MTNRPIWWGLLTHVWLVLPMFLSLLYSIGIEIPVLGEVPIFYYVVFSILLWSIDAVKLAKLFGKSNLYSVGLIFFGAIFYSLLKPDDYNPKNLEG